MADQIQNIRIKYTLDTDELDNKATKSLQGLTEEQKELTKEFDKANKEAKEQFRTLDKGTKDAKRSTSELSDKFRDLSANLPFIQAAREAQELTAAMGRAVIGTTQASRAMTILKVAIASTGIGLLVVAVASLVTYFKRTDEGATKLEGIFRAFNATLTVLASKLLPVGEALSKVFTDPKQAAIELFNFLKDQVVNRVIALQKVFESLGGIIYESLRPGGNAGQAIKSLNENLLTLATGFTGLGEEISKVTGEAYDLAFAFDALVDKEREFSIATAKAENQVKNLLIQAKNRTKSEQERLALLDKASGIETKNLNQALVLAKERLSLIQRENKISADNGQLSDEQLDAEAEQIRKIIQLEGQSLDLQERINTRKDMLLQEIADREKANADKYNKIQEDKLKTSLDQEKEFTEKLKKESDERIKDSIAHANAYGKAMVAAEEQIIARRREIQSRSAQLFSDLVSATGEIRRNGIEAEMTEMQEKQESELKNAEGNEQAKAFIKAKYEREERRLKREAAVSERSNALFRVAIDTALGISKTIAQNGMPLAIPFIGLAAAQGAAQAAVIASKPIPKYNKGTKSVPGVNRGYDTELALLQPGEGILPTDKNQLYGPSFAAMYDGTVPADVMNGFVLDYQKIKGSPSAKKENPMLDKLDTISKKLSSLKNIDVRIDQNGIRAYSRTKHSETEFLNNYFQS